jgi:hypothetical protein
MEAQLVRSHATLATDAPLAATPNKGASLVHTRIKFSNPSAKYVQKESTATNTMVASSPLLKNAHQATSAQTNSNPSQRAPAVSQSTPLSHASKVLGVIMQVSPPPLNVHYALKLSDAYLEE